MSVTNRSGLQCIEHPNQQITNFCLYANCLKPLCPDCVQIHTKFHQVQQIQSWKHCINKSAKSIKSTLQALKTIYQQQNKYRPFKNLQTVQNQNIKRLYQMKEKVHKVVDQIFSNQEQHIRMFIRNQYKIDQPDTTKLKQAIQQMEKLLMKLGHSGTVLSALKKSILLDHQSLLNFFGDMQIKQYKPINENFVLQNHDIYPQIKNLLQNSLSIRDIKQNNTIYNRKEAPINGNYTSPVYNKNQSFQSEGNRNIFESLKISVRNYFTPLNKYKLLHFFIPASNQLKTLQIQSAQKGNLNWKSVLFSGKAELPCYFKSIITPEGDIYLTGGSEDQKRCKQIYRYNYEKNSLDLVCKMTHPRSSHSICYANGQIYLIGGFSDFDGEVTRSCEVFNPRDKTCVQIAPLNTPSANSCATPFNDEYIFKFGGVLNKTEGNSLIQMYSIKKNKWIVVDIEKDRVIPTLQLLSFSAAVQINDSQIIVFGGYDNSQIQKPQRLCYTLQINTNKGSARIRNFNLTPLAYAQGFWNNNPIIHQGKVYALQNITDQQDQLTAIADERRVIVFNGDRWL